jgi:uncharacterized protein (DUF1800 family)
MATTSVEAAIAANRFGLGAREGELRAIAGDPRGWLKNQIAAAPGIPSELTTLQQSAPMLVAYFESRAQGIAEVEKLFKGRYRRQYIDEGGARTLAMIRSDAPFYERLVAFWSNHFTVSAKRPIVAGVAGAFEREAIRPGITGSFADLLIAVTRHPAMLLYLDNAVSIGPQSPAGRRTGKGLNENLAREILELHTLGVDAGYGQDDVVALARILTGWSVGRPHRQGTPGAFHFYPIAHEPGDKRLLGKTYREDGEVEARRALTDLARHTATARHIATKLARHFVADEPDPAAVDRLVDVFTRTDGDLMSVSLALVDLPQAWQPVQRKYKTPQDLVVSTLRATGFGGENKHLLGSLVELGQPPYAAPSPAGWPDTADHWATPEAVLRRAEWCLAVSRKVRRPERPETFLMRTVGAFASDATQQTVALGASAVQGRALVLASPEFQRR